MPSLLKITRPSDLCWKISLNNPPDNRLTNEVHKEMHAALDQVEKEWRDQSTWKGLYDKNRKGGALILTSELGKFFSNGLDFAKVITTPNFHTGIFNPLAIRLLTFPMVTIAALTGHTFAGGLMWALCCDYRIMTDGKAWACMNEIDFGAPFPAFFAAVIRAKCNATPALIRDISLGKRFTAPELLQVGLIDQIVPAAEVQERALQLGNKIAPKSAQGPWGTIKEELYYDCIYHGKKRRDDELDLPHVAAKKFYDRVGGKAKL